MCAPRAPSAVGEIKLPIVRVGKSQKSAKGVHFADFAAYFHERRKAATKECKALGA